MLRGVLADGGTASGAGIPGYDMAGKTGTANVVVGGTLLEHRTMWRRSSGSSRPTSPKLLVAVIVDRPQGDIYGGVGGRSGVPEDRRLGGPVLRDLAPLTRSDAPLARAASTARREPVVPLRADRGHPRDGVRQRRRRDPVADLAARALAVEQAGVGQGVEVLEHGLAGDRQLGGELGCGGLGVLRRSRPAAHGAGGQTARRTRRSAGPVDCQGRPLHETVQGPDFGGHAPPSSPGPVRSCVRRARPAEWRSGRARPAAESPRRAAACARRRPRRASAPRGSRARRRPPTRTPAATARRRARPSRS